MKNTNILLLFLILINATFSNSKTFLYSGQFLTDGGENSTIEFEQKDISIKLFDQKTGGVFEYSQEFLQVPVTRGYFQVHLGPNLPDLTVYKYLEISVFNNPLEPREEILATPVTLQSFNAQKLEGLSIDQILALMPVPIVYTDNDATNAALNNPQILKKNENSILIGGLTFTNVDNSISFRPSNTQTGVSTKIGVFDASNNQKIALKSDGAIYATTYHGDGSSLTNVNAIKLKGLNVVTTNNDLNLSGDNSGDNSANTHHSLVHTSGNESISGQKTFLNNVIFSGGVSGLSTFSAQLFNNEQVANLQNNKLSDGTTPWTANESAIASGSTSEYFRGDKTWQTLDKSAVGLSNVPNTNIAYSSPIAADDFDQTQVNNLRASKLADGTTLGNVATQDQNAISFSGGFVDGVTIGQTTSSTAKFTMLTATNIDVTTVNATTINGDGSNLTGLVTLSDNQTIAGIKTFSSIPVLPNTTPTSNLHVVSKSYVDSQIGADVSPADDFSQTQVNNLRANQLSDGTTPWSAKENTINAGTTSQYFRGDKSWQTLDKSVVGLSNVPNTNIAYSSTIAADDFDQTQVNNLRASQLSDGTTPWTANESAIASGTTTEYFRGDKTWQTLDKSTVGLSNVPNTNIAYSAPIAADDFDQTQVNNLRASKLADGTTLGSVATQDQNAVSFSGGFLDGVTIGQTTSSTAKFTMLTATNIDVTTINATTINATTLNGDGSNLTGLVKLSSNQTVAGIKTFSSIPFLPNTTPTSNLHVVSKSYVDTKVGSNVSPADDFSQSQVNNLRANQLSDGTTPWTANESAIASGTTTEYFRGDKTWQTLDKSVVGLSNVPNTNIAYSSPIAADDFDQTQVNNLRASKLADGTTLGSVATQDQNAISFSGGFLDGVTVGQTTSSIAKFTYLTATNIDVTTINGDGSNLTGLVQLSNNQTVAGVKTFSSIPILPNTTPTSNLHVVSKSYVDSQIGADAIPADDFSQTQVNNLRANSLSDGTTPWAANESAIASGSTSQYFRGDKTWQTLDKSVVGLSNVPNTNIAYSSAIAADDFDQTQVDNLRASKLADGTILGNVATQNQNAVSFSGGSLNGVTIGQSSASTAQFTNVTAISYDGDGANLTGLVQLNNNQTIAGTKTFSTIIELPASDPTTTNQATRKAYVDTEVARVDGAFRKVGTTGTLIDKLYISRDSSNNLYGDDATVKTHVNLGVGSTTGTNGQNYTYATVGGGEGNIASGGNSTIAGGSGNYMTSAYSVIVGGNSNSSSGDYSFIGGGDKNDISATFSTITGGYSNSSSGQKATIGGGEYNSATGYASTVGGGNSNTASGDYSNISGGRQNNTSGHNSAIVGGRNLKLTGQGSLGFRGGDNSSQITRAATDTVYFMETALCVSAANTDCASATYTKGEIFASKLHGDGSNLTNLDIDTISGVVKDTTNQTIAGTKTFSTIIELPASDPTTSNQATRKAYVDTQVSSVDGAFRKVGTTGTLIDGLYISRDSSNNLYGNDAAVKTHVNLGVASTTGTDGQNYIYATVGGGNNNTASGTGSTVGGGVTNRASAHYSAVGGGSYHVASGQSSTIGGGASNVASGNESIIGGGSNNSSIGDFSTVGGGLFHTASGQSSTIAGGSSNSATGEYSSIGGGSSNNTSGNNSVIVGGASNNTSGKNSAIIGGRNLKLTGDNSAGFRGGDNSSQITRAATDTVYFMETALCVSASNADCESASYAKGEIFASKLHGDGSNLTNLDIDTISGVVKDTTNQTIAGTKTFSTIIELPASDPTTSNQATRKAYVDTEVASVDGAFRKVGTTGTLIDKLYISRDSSNILYGDDATVKTHVNLGIGSTTGTDGQNYTYATVSGGQTNIASTSYSTIGGGQNNTASGSSATIAGGRTNIASGGQSFIGGGEDNTASGNYAFIGGGSYHTVSGVDSSVGGGVGNYASGSVSTIAGGDNNTASGNYTFIGGGGNNTASGEKSTIAGGENNETLGKNSAIIGGKNLKLTGQGSLGFRGGDNGSQITRAAADTVYFMETALCVSSSNTDCSSATYAKGEVFADVYNTDNSDYAEYFTSETILKAGDIVGLNPQTGKTKKYQIGDILLGVVSTKPGVLGNTKLDKAKSNIVALMGQVPFNKDQTIVEDGLVKTLDNKVIGYLLSTGDVYLNLSSNSSSVYSNLSKNKSEIDRLKQKNIQIENENKEIKKQLKVLFNLIQLNK